MYPSRLTLTGFKSFAEPQSFLVETGLTGIVGPNGCGKSNIVDALRWVMGEAGAKRLRGDEMEDVIFSGTTGRAGNGRASRNLAEVAMILDNKSRKAPAVYNNEDEIVITRVVEREKGSTYTINNRQVRAKDVQLLFADCGLGSGASAIVSQGRVAEIINLKPAERRQILEEAAGIVGLQSRRHEAELKLQAASRNLERLQDILNNHESQLASLQKQARHARGFRKLNEQIRQSHALILHLRSQKILETLNVNSESLSRVDKVLEETTRLQASLTAQISEIESGLDPLKTHEAEAAAALQRLELEIQKQETLASTARETKENLLRQLTQTEADLKRELDLKSDYEAQQDVLALELVDMEKAASESGGGDALFSLEDDLSATERDVMEAEEKLAHINTTLSRLEAQRTSLRESLENAAKSKAQAQEKHQVVEQEIERLWENSPLESDLELIRENQTQHEIEAENIKSALSALHMDMEGLQKQTSQARDSYEAARGLAARIRSELQALEKLVASQDVKIAHPVLSNLEVEAGFEKALGAAFPRELEASLDENSPLFWNDLKIHPHPFANHLKTLSDVVKAPGALIPSLQSIAVVEASEEALALLPNLKPGQGVVTRAGDFWRWDGFCAQSGADQITPAALKLLNQNKIKSLKDELTKTDEDVVSKKITLESLENRLQSLKVRDTEHRQREREIYKKLDDLRAHEKSLQDAGRERLEKLSSLRAQSAQLVETIESLTLTLSEKSTALQNLENAEELHAQGASLKKELAEKRDVLYALRAKWENIQRETQAQEKRLKQIRTEQDTLKLKLKETKDRLKTLEDRKARLIADQENLLKTPTLSQEQHQEMLQKHSELKDRRYQATLQLESAIQQKREAEKSLRHAESEHARAREERAGLLVRLETTQNQRLDLIREAEEAFHTAPEGVLAAAEITEIPDLNLTTLEENFSKLKGKRDTYGPVNLVAEQEAGSIEEKLTLLQKEKTDLDAAIQKLRKSIADINAEGRSRLKDSFEKVRDHFEKLFVRLFGGGKASLELVDNDDPLEAGLEILASPPGKRLQSLSLLSGGERTLTAIALLFAVFLTNPAPICVLDEVDAPLDDTNVDRFCTLLEDVARDAGTRFLVITHHRMTMARMHRLYGVTMPEPGISQLVSVDLGRALEHAEERVA